MRNFDQIKEKVTEDLKDLNVTPNINQFLIGYCLGLVSWVEEQKTKERDERICEHSGVRLSEKKT